LVYFETVQDRHECAVYIEVRFLPHIELFVSMKKASIIMLYVEMMVMVVKIIWNAQTHRVGKIQSFVPLRCTVNGGTYRNHWSLKG
jgi:hypothetical protein